VVTDLGVLKKVDGELQLVQVHPGVQVSDVKAKTGWDLVVSEHLVETEPPTELELATLRRLKAEAQR
jgi:glutaconate CoA-transferase subunit B